jgi:hypothetical protein
MRFIRLIITFFILLILAQINVLAVEARHIEATYKSCAQMNRKYPTGVAISSAVARKYPAKISRSVYISNVMLDFDDDGIVCEKESLQRSLNGPGLTTTTTTTTTTASSTGDSNLYIYPPRQPANPFILKYGSQYNFWVCSTGAYQSFMDVRVGSSWVQKAISKMVYDNGLCDDAKYPVAHVWTWKVDVSPGLANQIQFYPFGQAAVSAVVINS